MLLMCKWHYQHNHFMHFETYSHIFFHKLNQEQQFKEYYCRGNVCCDHGRIFTFMVVVHISVFCEGFASCLEFDNNC